MKFAITGHTSGIGKAIYQRLDPNIKGFSRSNGYDVNTAEGRHRIISESADCDTFINNAPAGFGQTYLLTDLYKAWRDQDKTIINVGSRIAELQGCPNLDLIEYQAEKTILKQMCYKLSTTNSRCKILYRWFGYVGTDAILAKYPHFTTKDYITVDQACDIILL
jgi:NAD(P)-dependent dehydrogenase (short-subunit alcohol dehydrogenase family)